MLISTYLLTITIVAAGAVRTWKPAELLALSSTVIVGMPTEVKPTGKKGVMRFGYRKEGRVIPIAFYSAKIKVIEVIKGEVSEREISILYSQVDYTRIPKPIHVQKIDITKDNLYLFYLNPIKTGGFAGALDNEFHDGQAVKILHNTKTKKNKKANK